MKRLWLVLPLTLFLLLPHARAAQAPGFLTRGEFLLRLFPDAPAGEDCFEDVSPLSPCYAAAAEACRLGVAVGEGGLFVPDRPIQRQEAAVFVYRWLTRAGRESEPGLDGGELPFSDGEEAATYAKEALLALFRLGALPEREGKLRPRALLEPAEAEELLAAARRIDAGERDEKLEEAILALVAPVGAKGEFSPLLSLPGGAQELYCTIFSAGREIGRGRAEIRNGRLCTLNYTELPKTE